MSILIQLTCYRPRVISRCTDPPTYQCILNHQIEYNRNCEAMWADAVPSLQAANQCPAELPSPPHPPTRPSTASDNGISNGFGFATLDLASTISDSLDSSTGLDSSVQLHASPTAMPFCPPVIFDALYQEDANKKGSSLRKGPVRTAPQPAPAPPYSIPEVSASSPGTRTSRGSGRGRGDRRSGNGDRYV